MLKIKALIWFLKLVTYLMNSCTEIEFSSPHSSRIKWLQSEFCPILAVQLFPQRYSTIGNFSSFSLKCSSSSTGRFRFLEFVELELGLEGVALGAAVGAGSGRLRWSRCKVCETASPTTRPRSWCVGPSDSIISASPVSFSLKLPKLTDEG